GNARALPPPNAIVYVVVDRRLASTSVVRTAYSTVWPSGESCGSDTAFIAAKSSNVIGRRACAPRDDASAIGPAKASASETRTVFMDDLSSSLPIYGA